MKNAFKSAVCLCFAAAAISCSTRLERDKLALVEDGDVTPAKFLAPYYEALKTLEPGKPSWTQDGLIHLGLPTERSVVIWYALPDEPRAHSPLSIAFLEGGGSEKPVPMSDVHHVFNRTHQVGRLEIFGLKAGIKHGFAISGGGFRTPRRVEAFTRAEKAEAFSFLAGSCFQPWHITGTDQTFITAETAAILRAFKARAAAKSATGIGPSFYLGLGDQLYIDPGASDHAKIAYLHGKKSQNLRGPLETASEVLGSLYKLHFGLKPMDESFSRLPSAMMWDDHDIRDGWGSQGDEENPAWQKYYSKAREAFLAFQAARNPLYRTDADQSVWETLSARPGQAEKAKAGSSVEFTFTWGNAEFFVADGRTDRNFGERRGLSTNQLDAVDDWLTELAKKKDEPKLLVFAFPVPLSGGYAIPGRIAAKLPIEGRDDAMERPYIIAEERERLLRALYGHVRAHRLHRLLILSGDVHYSGIHALRNIEDGALLGYEIVTSGLAQSHFNHLGPYWLTVARPFEGVKLESHGFYAGPAFAEIFVSAEKRNAPAEIKLLFYPGAESPGTAALELNVSNVGPEFARAPEEYPANEPLFNWVPWNQRTKSKLAEFLLDHWVGSGNAIRGGNRTAEVKEW